MRSLALRTRKTGTIAHVGLFANLRLKPGETHHLDEAATEQLTCRGVSSVGKLYFMYSTCCAVCWQTPKTQPTPRSDILSQPPPSYDSRRRQTTRVRLALP